MSSSLGVCWSFASLETFEAGHDSSSASCRPLSLACWRSCRSRLPRAVLASLTLAAPDRLFGGKIIPSRCVVPGSITPVVVFDDDSSILDDFAADEVVVTIERHDQQLARVEQPEVMFRQVSRLDPPQIADVLASGVVVPRERVAKTVVVAQWHVNDADACKALACGRRCADRREPVLHPCESVRVPSTERTRAHARA